MSYKAGNMQECFNFESRYRFSGEIMTLNFQTADETEWTMSEEWLFGKTSSRSYLQRLIFGKENHHERRYIISVEITSENNASGMIKVSKISYPVSTRISIPLENFNDFNYRYHSLTAIHGIQIHEKVLTDTFRYKVTISTTNALYFGSFPFRNEVMVFSDNIRSLLKTENFSDVVLTNGQVHIKAHRNILSARSPVFDKMLQSNTREELNESVLIPNIDGNILKKMFKYMYSGVLRPVDIRTAIDLYVEAEKYELLGLKNLCCLEMKRHLSAENGAFSLFPDVKPFEEELYEQSLDLVSTYINEVRPFVPWQGVPVEQQYLFRAIENMPHENGQNP